MRGYRLLIEALDDSLDQSPSCKRKHLNWRCTAGSRQSRNWARAAPRGVYLVLSWKNAIRASARCGIEHRRTRVLAGEDRPTRPVICGSPAGGCPFHRGFQRAVLRLADRPDRTGCRSGVALLPRSCPGGREHRHGDRVWSSPSVSGRSPGFRGAGSGLQRVFPRSWQRRWWAALAFQPQALVASAYALT
jgi:hypothetical protein